MGMLARTVGIGGMSLAMLAGCTLHETYPPALPAPKIPWNNTRCFLCDTPPPAELAWKPTVAPTNPAAALVPTSTQWRDWTMQEPMQRQCRGKGKARRCAMVPVSAVARSNKRALVEPSAQVLNGGELQYQYDPLTRAIYKIPTSPNEPTYLILPDGESLAMKLLLNPGEWETSTGKTAQEGSRQEVVVVRPSKPGLTARGLLVFMSGLRLHLKFVSSEQPGMLSVTWTMPAVPTQEVKPPLDKQPPVFDSTNAYADYRVSLQGKVKVRPPWYPEAIVDDGKNTLIKLPDLDGGRMPVVSGIQQNGKPALVQTRLYTRPDHGTWMYVQHIHPALELSDTAGIKVKVERVPPQQEPMTHVY